ncbi:MAG: cytochrome c, partial [Saprospiraceae bacterium]|nr:cytochrome c [Saprospiraceae bacterium]
MNFRHIYTIVVVAILLVVISCSPPEGNFGGSEYMPDMGHSIAYEANTYNYYRYNTWGTEDEVYEYSKPRNPVQGTIPRGYVGVAGSASPEATLAVMKTHA